jgi:hypothetical protein
MVAAKARAGVYGWPERKTESQHANRTLRNRALRKCAWTVWTKEVVQVVAKVVVMVEVVVGQVVRMNYPAAEVEVDRMVTQAA